MTRHVLNPSQFYLTAPAPCPYVSGRFERKVFTHLASDNAAQLNDVLTKGGFRRSQAIAYRPACDQCAACVSIRICVDDFERKGGLKRVWKRNTRLVGERREDRATGEQYSLFRRYLDSRHGDGGMVNMTVLDYAMMVEDSHVRTSLVEYRPRGVDTRITGRGEGELAAVCLSDRLDDGFSLVYSFFDPDLSVDSPGTFMILDHIERARAESLPYVYLGYWVEGSRKMDYKTRFRPHERLLAGGWKRFD